MALRRQHRKIDVHHHNFPPNIEDPPGFTLPRDNLPWCPENSLKFMDDLGIDITVLSLPEGWPVAKMVNRKTAEICKAHPDRFAFFATLPDLRKPEEALEELKFAFDELHACGVSMVSSYGDGPDAKYVGEDAFDPIWEELDRRGAIVFLHGAQTPSSTPWPHYFLGVPVTEVPNETYKAAAHLVVTGKKRRYPNVKIVLSHLGGSTVWLAPRVATLSSFMGSPLTPDEIVEDFKTFYFDTALSVTDATIAAMETFVSPDRILFGTDYCAITTDMAGWYIDNLDKIYADRPERLNEILRENALKLIPSLRALDSALHKGLDGLNAS